MEWTKDYNLDLEPDFQRAHVWTTEQRQAFVEYALAGGPGARTLYFAAPGWSKSITKQLKVEIVDGKQRLQAVRMFLRDELEVCGKVCSAWTGVIRMSTVGRFRFCIADIDRITTLRWYLALNTAGVRHTDDEIARVRALLHTEQTQEVLRGIKA